MMNFSSEDKWGEKRKALLAQQEEAVPYEETVETQSALYGDTSKTSPCCFSGWMFLSASEAATPEPPTYPTHTCRLPGATSSPATATAQRAGPNRPGLGSVGGVKLVTWPPTVPTGSGSALWE